MNNGSIPVNNQKKRSVIKIKNPLTYIAELVVIIPDYRITGKNYSQFLLGGWIPFV